MWVKKGTPFEPPAETIANNLTLKVWCAISANCRRIILRYEDTMTSQKYLQMLQTHLLKTFPQLNKEPNQPIFMEDNARPHIAKIVQD